jgi:phosphate transport system substrate-binding protein
VLINALPRAAAQSNGGNMRYFLSNITAGIIIWFGLSYIGGCQLLKDERQGSDNGVTLRGAGSTFIGPLMRKWRITYSDLNNINVDYDFKGSDYGIRKLIDGKIAFACIDSPLTQKQLDRFRKLKRKVIQVPIILEGVVLVYNLEGIKKRLHLTGPVLANIFLGAIMKWNDPAIQKLNPNAKLPAQNITVVYPGEPSETTSVFTHYLATVSKEWKKKVAVHAQ